MQPVTAAVDRTRSRRPTERMWNAANKFVDNLDGTRAEQLTPTGMAAIDRRVQTWRDAGTLGNALTAL